VHPAAGPSGSPTTEAPAASPSADDAPAGLLQEVRTASHADHDRLVFQFHGASAPRAHLDGYVEQVTEDPSDRPVALAGQAFLRVVFTGARLDTAPIESDPAKVRRYTGPRRLTPGLPLLKELAVAGDFEAVLSWGVGLDRPAAITVQALTGPARVVIDFWYAPPRQLVWPDRTFADAAQVQSAVDAGHEPWRLNPGQVVQRYAEQVLGWQAPAVRPVSVSVYVVNSAAGSAILGVIQPARQGTTGIWAIATVAR
jgi:hypothetical protein